MGLVGHYDDKGTRERGFDFGGAGVGSRVGPVDARAEPIGRLATQHRHRRGVVADDDRSIGPPEEGEGLVSEGITLVHLATIRPADTIGRVEASTDPAEAAGAPVMPIGRSGRLEAMPLTVRLPDGKMMLVSQ